MKTVFNTLLLIVISNILTAQVTKVLFIGNSYTAVNNLPLLFHDVALSKGDTVYYDSNAPGGYTFQLQSTDPTSISKISQQAWDYVVLQEQSQMPAFPPSQVATDTYPYATRLDSLINANDSCTETVFYMTWGRQNGDASNCAFYPPICTYAGMQQRLRESYLQMAQDNNATVSPVGVAWKHVRDNFPAINLYNPDESHPSIQGSYLAACVFYSTMFHKTPLGASFPSGVTPAEALTLQTVGGATVLDSISLWQGNGDIPNSAFTNTITGNSVQFNNISDNSTSYAWNFGDATSTIQTNPLHSYSSLGQYIVSLTASNGCKSFVSYDTLQITTSTDIDEEGGNNFISVYPNPATNNLTIETKKGNENKMMCFLYNSIGQLVYGNEALQKSKLIINLANMPTGSYYLIVRSEEKTILNQKVIIKR